LPLYDPESNAGNLWRSAFNASYAMLRYRGHRPAQSRDPPPKQLVARGLTRLQTVLYDVRRTSIKGAKMTGHEITRTEVDGWLSATCECGAKCHLTTRKAQVTAWINRHIRGQ
ncbi:MAG: hypothetical protein ACREHG_02590, partial [Candidatus Saccharimonadales bacterium]